MPPLAISQAYNSVNRYGEPSRQVNMYVVQAETPEGTSLRPRPSLELRYTLGAGPVRAMIQTDGDVGSGVYAISGSDAYYGETLIGNMTGSEGATIASSGAQVVFTLGLKAYVWDGSSFAEITDPDLPDVSAVIFISGRFFYQVASSDTWYFSGIFDAATIDGLAFATAETLPDATRGVAVVNNEAWFFGTQSVEPHYPTGNASAPLQLAQGRTLSKGCASQRTICAVDNTLFWLGNNGKVYRASNVAKAISTEAIDAAIKSAADITACTAFTTTFGGHEFYVLSVPGVGSYAYDAATDQWAAWETYGEDTFRILSGCMLDMEAYLGDSSTGNVYGWSDDINDDDGAVITRVFSAFIPTNSRGQDNFNVSLAGLYGQGVTAGTIPYVEMRTSDDNQTWTGWQKESLGAIGDYEQVATFWQLGRIGSSGRRFEFRVTDPVRFSASGLSFNEHTPQ